VVDPTGLGAVLGEAVFGIEHPIGDFLPQKGSSGLTGLGVVEVLNGGTERGARPETEFLSHHSSEP
jgi:hypothetical protein